MGAVLFRRGDKNIRQLMIAADDPGNGFAEYTGFAEYFPQYFVFAVVKHKLSKHIYCYV